MEKPPGNAAYPLVNALRPGLVPQRGLVLAIAGHPPHKEI